MAVEATCRCTRPSAFRASSIRRLAERECRRYTSATWLQRWPVPNPAAVRVFWQTTRTVVSLAAMLIER